MSKRVIIIILSVALVVSLICNIHQKKLSKDVNYHLLNLVEAPTH